MRRLIALLLWVEVFVYTFLDNEAAFTEIVWYMTLYFVAAYIRLYPARWMESSKITGWLFLGCVVVSMASVVAIMAYNTYFGTTKSPYYFVSDSGKVMAFLTGVLCFLFFKNLKMPNISFINKVASTTYGVLLIHAHSSTMRSWLWGDVFDMPSLAGMASPIALFGVLVLIAVIVFTVCSAIDMLRIQFIEQPVFNWVYRNKTRIEAWASRITAPFKQLVDRIF